MKSIPFVLVAALMLPLAPSSAAAETRYGSFVHDDRISHTLFLTGEIRQGDSFELRKALRNHEDIAMVVMGSAGGNLYEGLQMGSILRDKGISTFVPAKVSCESSCANMFFGGAKRKAEGQLGVHQFYSGERERNAPLGEAQAVAQYTMADVIGIMNELSTPPFVYEKMLGTTQMYYFSEDEKRRIDLEPDETSFLELQIQATNFILSNPTIIARPSPEVEVPTAETLAPPTPSTPENPPSDRDAKKTFEDTDFFGADIYPDGQRGVSIGECEQVCRGDASCAAWSYVHATQWCWPKSAVGNISFGYGITSGIVDYSRVDPTIFDRPFLELTAADFPGNDLLPRGIPNTTLDECRSACQASTSCRAFTWVGEKDICFPKYAIGKPERFLGAISGVKR